MLWKTTALCLFFFLLLKLTFRYKTLQTKIVTKRKKEKETINWCEKLKTPTHFHGIHLVFVNKMDILDRNRNHSHQIHRNGNVSIV